MKIAELISKLQTFPEDMEIIVNSYEEGYDPLTGLREINIEKRTSKDWYYGVYEDAKTTGQKALLLYSTFFRSEKKDKSSEVMV